MKQDNPGKADDPGKVAELEGRYANAFQVGHNAFEFLLDFGQASPAEESAHFHTRIIPGPAYAKAFSQTLREAIDSYEKTFGVIPGAGN